ncbi:MAG: DUF2167 domain-containing protein [Verrucomicrobia bacterium]|nr:DUF2167 domain-containing protein [Verrucomicrobiota bacterium]
MNLQPFLHRSIHWMVLCLFCLSLRAEEKGEKLSMGKNSPMDRLSWIQGPTNVSLTGRATLKIPKGFRFLEAKGAQEFLKKTGNRPSGQETGLLMHTQDEWWVILEFEEIGYVKDDEKKELDADKLIASYRQGSESMNEARQERGTPPIRIVGWHVAPNYNDITKNLEWSVEAESGGEKFVNYNVRLLGRKGVTKVTLIEDRTHVDATLPLFREILRSHQYSSGESYAEYRQGDRIAQYGLGALVLGGAAAAAAKFGLFAPLILFIKKAWKVVAAAVVGAVMWIKNWITGRNKNEGGWRRP